jgi:hypothetical protein
MGKISPETLFFVLIALVYLPHTRDCADVDLVCCQVSTNGHVSVSADT